MKKLSFLFLVISFLLSFSPGGFSPPAEAASIDNIAITTYSDDDGQTYIQPSDKTTTQVGINLAVTATVPNPNLTGPKNSTFKFPATITNTGVLEDSYQLTIQDLVTGLVSSIYADVNGNGIIDPEDTVITTTPVLAPNESLKIIIVLKDTKGFSSGRILSPSLSLVSVTDPTVKAIVPLSIKISGGTGPGGGDGGTPTPRPTATPSKPPEAPRLSVKKTSFPTGRVETGDELSYLIEVKNIGNVEATDVFLLDKLPAGLIVLTDTSSASIDGAIEYSEDGSNWESSISCPDTNKACIRYIRVKWSDVIPSTTVTFFFKVIVGDTGGTIENVAWTEVKLPDGLVTSTLPEKAFSNLVVNTVKNRYIIAGTIYDKQGTNPVEGVIVDVYGTSGLDAKKLNLKDDLKVGTETTGKTGKFAIEVPDKGTYRVVYSFPESLASFEDRVIVEKPGTTFVPVHIRGKVLDSQTLMTIAGAKVDISNIDSTNNVLNSSDSDNGGVYHFSRDIQKNDLKPGTYTLRVTKAEGYVTFLKTDVKTAPGDVILNEDILIDPSGVVYDAFGGMNTKIAGAEVKIISNCDDPASILKLDDLYQGTPQKNPFITEKDGFYHFNLNKAQLTDKSYCLMAKATGFKSEIYLVRFSPNKLVTVKTVSGEKVGGKFMMEVFDEANNRTVLNNVESVPYNIKLKPLKVFDLKKSANKGSIELGDVVTYTVEVTNVLNYLIKNGFATDKLPFGFKYVENTLRVNDQPVTGFKALDELKIPLGDMDPGKKFTIVYQARTGIRVEGGPSINKVFAEGTSENNTPVKEGPATATVFVKKGVFSSNGTIIGRVYIDTNDNGIPDDNEPGVEGIVIYTSNGIRVITDNKGKYSIPDIGSGDFIVHLDKTSLPENIYLHEDAAEISGDTNLKLNSQVKPFIDLSQISNVPFYITNKTDLKFQLGLEKGNKAFIVLADGTEIPFESGKTVNKDKLNLNEKVNNLKFKVIDDYLQVVEQRNFQIYLINELASLQKSSWIGQDDIIKRIFVPESGLAKANFRLVKLPGKLTIPANEKAIKENNTLMGVYAYPAHFAAREIKKVSYPDIKKHWAQETVEFESGLEIIHGYPDGLFKPDRSITRSEATKLTLTALKSYDIKLGTNFGFILTKPAKVTSRVIDANGQVVKVFHQDEQKQAGVNTLHWDGKGLKDKVLPVGKYTFEVKATDADGNINYLTTLVEIVPTNGNYKPEGTANFKDINQKHWASSFVKVGAEEKLVTGYPDNTFKPDKLIPRYEIAIIAVNALNLNLKDAKETLPFDDAAEVPQWARKYVYLAYTNNLLPMFPDNKFRPKRPISRAEIAVFVRNLIRQQKIEAQLRGSVSKDLNSLVIDHKTIDLSKNKVFEIPSEKSSQESFHFEIPGIEEIKTIPDQKYEKKSIMENTVGGVGEIPVPSDNTMLTAEGDIEKATQSEAEKAEDARINFTSKFEINFDNEKELEYVFSTSQIAITISAPEGLMPKIMANGTEISYDTLGRTKTNNKTLVKTYTYYGIPVNDGKNIITASFTDSSGKETTVPMSKTVYVRGKADKIVIDTVKIPADGRTTQVVTIKVTDKSNNPVPDDTFVTVNLENGSIKTPDQNPMMPGDQYRTLDGKVEIDVLPPNETGTFEIKAEIENVTGKGYIDFITPLREPIFIGMANGNSGYSFIEGKTFADDPKGKAGLNAKIGASLFTQGTIFDEYLLTFAFDTQRKLNALADDPNILLRDRAEDTLYPIYGDSSQLNQVAVSNSNVFFKLEKDKSSLLWGDFTTGSRDTDVITPRLANYNRVLTGGKLTLDLPYAFLPEIDLFGAMTNQSFGRDEIKGAGVSGPYYTSQYPMVNGSEKITIETRDRVFTTKILKTKILQRLTDYNIEYGNGSVTFSQPVASFDENLNPNYIVITYEHYQTSVSNSIWGGIIKQPLPFGATIGGSYIREIQPDHPYQLVGFNLTEKLNNSLDFIAEYANSFSDNKYGSSYRSAIYAKPTDNFTLSGEYMMVDTDFVNKTGASLTPGSDRYTAKADYKPFESTTIGLEYNRDNNFIQKQLIQAIRGGITQDIFSHNISLNLEGRNFTDPKDKNKTLTSGLIGIAYKTPTFFNISLSLSRDQNILGDVDPSKPTITTIGADYAVTENIKLFAKQNFIEREKLTTATVIGVDTTFKNDLSYLNAFNVGAKYQIDGTIAGRPAMSSIGLNNRINVLPDLLLGVAFERVTSEKTAGKDKLLNLDEDHNAWSFSLDYTPKDIGLRTSVKYDFRDGLRSSNLFALNAAGSIGDDFGAFGRFSISSSSDQARRTSTEGLLGLAYRPLSHDYFNALLKYQLKNRIEGATQPSEITNHIFSLEGFFQPAFSWEIYTKLALKNSWDKTGTFNPIASNISLGLARITYKLLYNFELVGEYRNLTQFETFTSFNDFTTEIGFYPIKDLRLAFGYNFFGYNDKDLATSNYISQGPYVGLSMKIGNLGSLWGQNGVVTKKDLIEENVNQQK
jgi:uncharacterized repeat protein (TIGR01451 family)